MRIGNSGFFIERTALFLLTIAQINLFGLIFDSDDDLHLICFFDSDVDLPLICFFDNDDIFVVVLFVIAFGLIVFVLPFFIEANVNSNLFVGQLGSIVKKRGPQIQQVCAFLQLFRVFEPADFEPPSTNYGAVLKHLDSLSRNLHSVFGQRLPHEFSEVALDQIHGIAKNQFGLVEFSDERALISLKRAVENGPVSAQIPQFELPEEPHGSEFVIGERVNTPDRFRVFQTADLLAGVQIGDHCISIPPAGEEPLLEAPQFVGVPFMHVPHLDHSFLLLEIPDGYGAIVVAVRKAAVPEVLQVVDVVLSLLQYALSAKLEGLTWVVLLLSLDNAVDAAGHDVIGSVFWHVLYALRRVFEGVGSEVLIEFGVRFHYHVLVRDMVQDSVWGDFLDLEDARMHVEAALLDCPEPTGIEAHAFPRYKQLAIIKIESRISKLYSHFLTGCTSCKTLPS